MKFLLTIISTLLIPLFFHISASGLTYFNAEAEKCRENNLKTNYCKIEICKDENVLRNWPVETYTEDCSKYDSLYYNDNIRIGIGVFAIVVILVSFIFWWRHRS